MEQANRDYFENYQMHQFFYDVYSNARTGVLKVYFPDSVVKTVYFSEGNIIYASSNGEKDKLITILIKYKKLSQEQLDAALRQMDKSISLGRNLVNMGFITHKELIWAVKVQVISIIHSIIILKQGDYLFLEGPLPDGVINLPLNTMKVLFDSIIMFQDREWIAEKVQKPDTVYKKTLLFEEGKNRLITNPDLLEVAEAIDGKRTLSELTSMTTLDDFKVFKLLYALKFLTLVEEKLPEATLPASEDIFELQDEPEEDLELAEEEFVSLGESYTEEGKKEEPTVQLEAEELPFHDKPEISNDAESTEKIEISDSFKPEVEFSEPEPAAQREEENNKDVFVEFKLQEDELSYVDESAEENLQVEEPETQQLDEHGPEKTVISGEQAGFPLTEQDIDSVILDKDEESPEAEEETKRLSLELGSQENDATLMEQDLSDDESFEEEVIDASAGGSGKWLLVTLIIISVVLFSGTMYYYQFWLPQQEQNNTLKLPPEKTQLAQSVPKADVTSSPITSLDNGSSAVTSQADTNASVTTKNERITTVSGAENPGENTKTSQPGTISEATPQKITGNNSPATGINVSVKPEKQKIAASAKQSAKPIVQSMSTSQKTVVATPKKTREKTKKHVSKTEKKGMSTTAPGSSIATTASTTVTSTGKTQSTTSPKTPKPVVRPKTKKSAAIPEKSILVQYESYISQAKEAFSGAKGTAVTLQLEIACKAETIEQALRLLKAPEKLFLVPFHYGGSDCVIVCFGLFNSNREAMNALNNLPQVFYEDNNEPFVASVNRLKKRF